jgi:hypothetical protein
MIYTDEIKQLEQLAAWHRINADHAGAPWVWEARLRTAEELERRATDLRNRRRRDLTTQKVTGIQSRAGLGLSVEHAG